MENNHELELACQFIEHTGTHLFLTGKAGTGKTTFLRQLKEKSPKRMVVVAPTGIAAINAGGVTIHSFFQLSFAPYIPDSTFTSTAAPTYHKFGKEKISIIRSIDLLVIDEISMVRADVLDAMDAVLRRYRDRYKPFGGVQLLMIGDLHQLAPVVKEGEWQLLSRYYDTPFFFGSLVLKETEYVTIELKHVYRQSDTRFINLLNRIREKTADETVLAELNRRHIPNFWPKAGEGYIRLTTHNYKAQRDNSSQLEALPGRPHAFKASIEGVFPDTSYPADEVLTVKKGAQIMFIKNDSSGEHRFYNGKIGLVTEVSDEGIFVRGNEDTESFLLETDEWTNSKYSLNPVTKEITEEVEGTFRQYPIRLAWSITIHKSQGMTFERAIIDAGFSFAHGQVYVALSRCKSLEGLVLSSPLRMESIISDDTIDSFNHEAASTLPDADKLNQLQRQYFYELLCEQFDFHLPERDLNHLLRLLDEHLYRLYPKLLIQYKEASERYKTEITQVGDVFQKQYTEMMSITDNYTGDEHLHQRIVAGAHYFRTKLEEIVHPLLSATKIETDNKELRKKTSEALNAFRQSSHIKHGTLHFTEKEGFSITAFLKHKAILTLGDNDNGDSQGTKKRTSSASRTDRASSPRTDRAVQVEVPSDILHPGLYSKLIAWRNAEASAAGLPVYTIIQQKAILGIVNLLPADIASLIRIPYFGRKGAEKYGETILEMVNCYVEEKGVQRPEFPVTSVKKEATSNTYETHPANADAVAKVIETVSKSFTASQSTANKAGSKPIPLSQTTATPKVSKQDTKEISYNLFCQGMSLEEIARTRELVTGTIAGHLEAYLRKGKIKLTQLVTQDKIDKVHRHLRQYPDQRGLTQIKVAMGDDVSYADIRLILAAVE